MAPATPMINGYKILLMNPGPEGNSPAKKRQEAFSRVVEDTKPSIIFTQECNNPFVKHLSPDYARVGVDDAGFIFNVNDFLPTDLNQNTSFIRLFDDLRTKQKISRDFEFRGRVVRFISKGVPDLDVLAVSWHGKNNNVRDQGKLKFLKDLFVVVKEMRMLPKFLGEGGEMLPVIIGGDFNFEVSKWPRDPDFFNHMYTASDRRKDRVIDLFVSTRHLTVVDCKFVDMSFKLHDEKPASDYLGHDPIEGVLAYSVGRDHDSDGSHADTGGIDDSNRIGDSSNSECDPSSSSDKSDRTDDSGGSDYSIRSYDSGRSDPHAGSSDQCGVNANSGGKVCKEEAGETVENKKPKDDKPCQRNDVKGKVTIKGRFGRKSHGGKSEQGNPPKAPTSGTDAMDMKEAVVGLPSTRSYDSGRSDPHAGRSDHCGVNANSGGKVCKEEAGETVENKKPKDVKPCQRNDVKGKVTIKGRLGKKSHGGKPEQLENPPKAPTSRTDAKDKEAVVGLPRRTDIHPSTCMKPSSQPTAAASANGYNILLISTGSGIPVAKCKDALGHVKQLVADLKPSIIFTQQNSGPFVDGLGHDYSQLGTPKAGFIFNNSEFTHQDLTSDDTLSGLVKGLQEEKRISEVFEFFGRVQVVRFTSKIAPDLDVIALAWYGQYRKKSGGRFTDVTMITFLKELFLIVKEMQKLQNFRGNNGQTLPCIIGGDFKIDVAKWPSDPTFDYHEYTQSARTKKPLVDLFVTTKDITVRGCEFLKNKEGTMAISDYLKNDVVHGMLAHCSLTGPH